MEITYRLEELNTVAEKILSQTEGKSVFALHGEMGAGKTTFVNALCAILQVKDTISSPTFPIINEYETSDGGTVFHIDLYRLNSAREALYAGVEECLLSGSICFVEWPERAPGIFPDHTTHLYFKVLDGRTRRIAVVDN